MGTEKSLPSDCHFAWICWPLVLFWSISLPVELVLLALLEGCLKERSQGCLVYTLKTILHPAKSNPLGCSLFLVISTSGSHIPLPGVIFWGRTLGLVVLEANPPSW